MPPTPALLARYSAINAECWKLLEQKRITRDALMLLRYERLFAEFGLVLSPAAVSERYVTELGRQCHLIAGAEELPEAKHIFSHVEWHMRGIRIRLTAPVQAPADGGMGELIFADKGELWTRYPLPGAFAAYRRLV